MCISLAKSKEKKTGIKQKIISFPYVLCILILTLVATCRHISPGIGGSDAPAYKLFFETCLSDHTSIYYLHFDVLYRWFNIVVRLFTSNYYVYSIIFYGIIATCIIYFTNEFLNPRNSKLPLILIFYLYLRGFNTYRSNLAIAILLLSFVLYKKNKKILAYLLAFSTFFIHKASILYAFSLIFLDMFKNKKVKIKYCIILILITFIVGRIFQPYLMSIFSGDETNAYTYYMSVSIKESFFANYWKICFEQFIVLFLMILFKKSINYKINEERNYLHERNVIWQLCIFDFITIPVTYILGIWRGYEYLYLPRLVMLGIIIGIINERCNRNSKFIVNAIVFILIISWMIFRIYNTWEDSYLLPYVFEPFLNWVN